MIAQSDLESICSALATTGYIILPQLLPPALTNALYKRIHTIAPQFQTAGIGRQQKHQINPTLRSDRTQWLQGEDTAERDYLNAMAQLQTTFNRQLFLGLSEYESHFAHYTSGAFYQRHVDAFTGKSSRLVTTLLYLNDNWQVSNGGELLLYLNDTDTVLERILPTYGKMMIFMSDQFPHEVLPANRDRYSISGWFRTDAIFPHQH